MSADTLPARLRERAIDRAQYQRTHTIEWEAADRIEALEREVTTLADHNSRLQRDTGPLIARIEVLEKSNRALAEALRWYAGDGSTYDGIDVGQRARAALASIPEQE